MAWASNEDLRLSLIELADGIEWGFESQCCELSGAVAGQQPASEMATQVSDGGSMKGSTVVEASIAPPFAQPVGVAVGPGVVRLGLTVVDTIFTACRAKDMIDEPRSVHLSCCTNWTPLSLSTIWTF
jgi:hypothetical protein